MNMSQAKLVEAIRYYEDNGLIKFSKDFSPGQLAYNLCEEVKQALSQAQSEQKEHDLSVHGVAIEKDGKRIDPKDFYKVTPPTQEEERQLNNLLYGLLWKYKQKGMEGNLNLQVHDCRKKIVKAILSAGWRKCG